MTQSHNYSSPKSILSTSMAVWQNQAPLISWFYHFQDLQAPVQTMLLLLSMKKALNIVEWRITWKWVERKRRLRHNDRHIRWRHFKRVAEAAIPVIISVTKHGDQRHWKVPALGNIYLKWTSIGNVSCLLVYRLCRQAQLVVCNGCFH